MVEDPFLITDCSVVKWVPTLLAPLLFFLIVINATQKTHDTTNVIRSSFNNQLFFLVESQTFNEIPSIPRETKFMAKSNYLNFSLLNSFFFYTEFVGTCFTQHETHVESSRRLYRVLVPRLHLRAEPIAA